jgi:hypothetical protein
MEKKTFLSYYFFFFFFLLSNNFTVFPDDFCVQTDTHTEKYIGKWANSEHAYKEFSGVGSE